jgi:hypothetical protein
LKKPIVGLGVVLFLVEFDALAGDVSFLVVLFFFISFSS